MLYCVWGKSNFFSLITNTLKNNFKEMRFFETKVDLLNWSDAQWKNLSETDFQKSSKIQ